MNHVYTEAFNNLGNILIRKDYINLSMNLRKICWDLSNEPIRTKLEKGETPQQNQCLTEGTQMREANLLPYVGRRYLKNLFDFSGKNIVVEGSRPYLLQLKGMTTACIHINSTRELASRTRNERR